MHNGICIALSVDSRAQETLVCYSACLVKTGMQKRGAQRRFAARRISDKSEQRRHYTWYNVKRKSWKSPYRASGYHNVSHDLLLIGTSVNLSLKIVLTPHKMHMPVAPSFPRSV